MVQANLSRMYAYCIPARLFTNTTPPTTAPTTRQDTTTREPTNTISGLPAELSSLVWEYDEGEGEIESPVEKIYNNRIACYVMVYIYKHVAIEHSQIIDD